MARSFSFRLRSFIPPISSASTFIVSWSITSRCCSARCGIPNSGRLTGCCSGSFTAFVTRSFIPTVICWSALHIATTTYYVVSVIDKLYRKYYIRKLTSGSQTGVAALLLLVTERVFFFAGTNDSSTV